MKLKLLLAMLLCMSLQCKADNSVIFKDNLKILLMGNSYMYDATAHLKAIATTSGADVKNMCIYRLHRTSSSFLDWVNVYNDEDVYEYQFTKCLGGLTSSVATGTGAAGDGSLFRQILTEEQWDLIVIQTSSLYAPYYDDWFGTGKDGHIEELLEILRTNQPDAQIGSFLIHSYWDNYVHNGEKSSLDRWQLIANSTKKLAKNQGVDFVIPYGTAIENLRASSLNNDYDLTRDGTQLSYGLARYTASCCVYEALIAPRTGISCIGNTFTYEASGGTYPAVDVTEENAPIAQKAATLAIEYPYTVKNPEEAEPVPENVSISVSAAGIGTYCSKFDLDFSETEDIKAYIVTGFKSATNRVVIQRVMDVPAGTGILVKGEQGEYTIPCRESLSYYLNMLVGTTKDVLLSPSSGAYTNFVLSKSKGKLGFYTLSNDIVMGANKSYLQLPTSILDNANKIDLEFEEDVDGISDVNMSQDNNEYFSLQGVRMRQPQKGIYIVNGKKIVVR